MVELQQGLLITAIGMGLVFAVIIFLWGLMVLMMRLTSGNKQVEDPVESVPAEDATSIPEEEKVEEKRRAAAAAVAVEKAISQRKDSAVNKNQEAPVGALSPWQTVHRLRQLETKKR